MSTIDLTLRIWRQKNNDALGEFQTYILRDISTDMSFLEMIDVLNEQLTREGKDPVAFDHDCREGICGMCGAVVDGVPHGPDRETTLCQLHMRKFKSGDTIVIEPFRSIAFPIKKDLMVDRSALDRIIQAGGYVSVNTGGTVTATPSPSAQKRLSWQWMRQPASVAVPVWPVVPTVLRCFLRGRRSHSSACCLKVILSARSGPAPWSCKWTKRDSVTAPTKKNASSPVPRPFRSGISPA